MTVTLTKLFEFSASHAQDGHKVVGHNYILQATFLAPDAHVEAGLAEKVEASLIQKVHSKDLGEHVDFLKGVPLDDPALLRAFWTVLEPAVRPARLSSLSLDRDRRTRWTLTAPAG